MTSKFHNLQFQIVSNFPNLESPLYGTENPEPKLEGFTLSGTLVPSPLWLIQSKLLCYLSKTIV